MAELAKSPRLEHILLPVEGWMSRDRAWWFCGRRLRRFWDVPTDAKFMWVIAHDRPARDRIEVRWMKRGKRQRFIAVESHPQHLGYEIALIVERLLKKRDRIYVELWYE